MSRHVAGAAARPLLPLLERLKTAGFSATERAQVVKEYVTFCHRVSSPDDKSDTPNRRLLAIMSERVADRLWALERPEQMHPTSLPDTYLSGLREDAAAAVLEVFGRKLLTEEGRPDMSVAQDVLRGVISMSGDVMESADRGRWVDVLSGMCPPSWKILVDQEMDDEDVLDYVRGRQPHFASTQTLTDGSLDQAWEHLGASLENAGIGYTSVDPLTASDPEAVETLAISLDRVQAAYKLIGAPSAGLNRVDLGIVSCFGDGTSGFMRASPTTGAGHYRPMVQVSSAPGWDISEVLIHEFLHAHDALLGRLPAYDAGHAPAAVAPSRLLLSDLIIDPISAARELSGASGKRDSPAVRSAGSGLISSPLAQTWSALSHDLFHMADTIEHDRIVPLIRSGLVARWAMLGIDGTALGSAVAGWINSSDPSSVRDSKFHDTVSTLIAATSFAASQSFRSDVLLAELRVTEKISDQSAVYTQFVDHFGNLTKIDAPRANARSSGAYSPDYFKDLAEIMARSIQLVLDTPEVSFGGKTAPLPPNSNPFSRSLAYPESGLAKRTVELWSSFFQSPEAQEAYGRLAASDVLLMNTISKGEQPSVSSLAPVDPLSAVAPVTAAAVKERVRIRQAKKVARLPVQESKPSLVR